MSTGILTLRKHWLAATAAVVLLAAALTAGTLFAANERQNSDIQPSSGAAAERALDQSRN